MNSPIFILNVGFDIVNSIRGLNLKSNCLSCQCLDKDLHLHDGSQDGNVRKKIIRGEMPGGVIKTRTGALAVTRQPWLRTSRTRLLASSLQPMQRAKSGGPERSLKKKVSQMLCGAHKLDMAS
jgi:hypothetical protein